ncbi:MAG: hypothetical protein CSB55_05585 [Candidatus Cloacimonadota bacterium]|nr:MAG: hypothetical protein CSB55_05585 [Candidatus Cloacimonadota bacterium]
MKDLYSLIKKRRSCRKFKNESVPEEILRKIADAARFYASPSNCQSCRFTVLTEDDKKELLSHMEKEKEDILTCPDLSERDIYKIKTYYRFGKAFADAPLSLAFGTADRKSLGQLLASKGLFKDTETPVDIGLGIALQNFSLLCVEEDLGLCIYTAPMFFLREYKNTDFDFNLKGFIAIGYPDEKPEPLHRLPVEEFCKF